MWLEGIVYRLKRIRLRAIAALAIVLVLVALAWQLVPGLNRSFVKGDGGIVVVDSPEVYSRERLINDRFRQVSWLEDELDNANNQYFGNQAISDLRQIWGLEANVGVSTSGDAVAAPGVAGADKDPEGAGSNGQDLSVSPNERFRDVLAYREEIRTEMMETLLDDRHDIKGNTLYRLKFDTTILPEDNTEKLVVVQVMLSKAALCGETPSDPSSVPCMSVDSIHDEWVKQTELKINKAMEGTINYIRAMNLPEVDFANFVRYLQGNLPREEDIAMDMPFEMESDLARRTYVDRTIANVKNWDRLVELDGLCMSKQERRVKSINASLRPGARPAEIDERECYSPAYTFYQPQANRSNIEIYRKFRELLHRYYAKELHKTKPFQDFKNAHLRFEPRPAYLPVGESRPEPVSKADLEIIKEAENAELALLRNVVANYYINRYSYSPLRMQKSCDEFYANKLTVFEDQSLSCLAHLEKTTCLDVEHCAVRVTSRVPMMRRMLDCPDGADPMTNDCVAKRIRDRFEDLLDFGETYYSYSITPKERSQRILSVVSERRQKQLALSLLAKSASSLDPGAVESLTRVIEESAASIEQIQRKPLILSFGRGQAVTGDDGGTTADGIDFGWIIGPKYLVSGNSADGIGFVHAPVQYSLSAVISVPSWWTAINLQIDTCWIEQNEITQTVQKAAQDVDGGPQGSSYVDNICNSGSVRSSYNNTINYIARLPGSPSELPRKFGYEIERAPAIQDTRTREPLADFFVGQENASLIIKGDELWRSTVVTMGNQKADNIEVLPNMKGIIARFNRVDIPDKKISIRPLRNTPGPFEPCVVYSKIVVWTSEGKTEQPLYVRIHPAAANNQYPTGFGDCDTGDASPPGSAGNSAKPDGKSMPPPESPGGPA